MNQAKHKVPPSNVTEKLLTARQTQPDRKGSPIGATPFWAAPFLPGDCCRFTIYAGSTGNACRRLPPFYVEQRSQSCIYFLSCSTRFYISDVLKTTRLLGAIFGTVLGRIHISTKRPLKNAFSANFNGPLCRCFLGNIFYIAH